MVPHRSWLKRPVRRGGSSLFLVAVCLCPSRKAAAVCGGHSLWSRHGCSFPPFLFSYLLLGGGGSCGWCLRLFPVGTRRWLRERGSCWCCFPFFCVAVHWWLWLTVAYWGHVPRGRLSPQLFFRGLRLRFPAGGPGCVRGPVVGASPVRRRGVRVDPSGAVFLLDWRWFRVRCGPPSVAGACRRLGGVISGCPSGWSRGRRSWSCRFLWLRGSVTVAPAIPRPSLLPVYVLVGRGGLPLWPVPAVSCSYVGLVCPPSSGVFALGGGCLVISLPSLCRRMHWSVNGVTNWLADCAVACRCVVLGLPPSPGSVHRAAYVQVGG